MSYDNIKVYVNKPSDLGIELYKYMSFEYFVDMVDSEELVFVDPFKCWPDAYEGYLFKLLQTKEGKEKFEEVVKRVVKEKGMSVTNDKVMNTINKIDRTLVRLMCWTDKKDNVEMWNAYSYNSKAIMIKVSTNKIGQLNYSLKTIDGEMNIYVGIKKIEYEPELNLYAILSKMLKEKSLDYTEAFLPKRNIYNYESEYRIAAHTLDENKTLRLSYSDIDDFIEDVMVHPDADDSFVEIVERFCRKNKLPFSGKSKLHTFEIEKIVTE